jgi:transposase
MAARFVSIDHDTPMLLPRDLRDWVPEDHLVHFIMEAVGLLDVSTARVNHRGTGSEQYPPGMMLGLLIYCYATGTFSSRRIERLTYENVAVRFLCADRHPDHDSICTFRRENRVLLESSFHQVLEVAARLRVLRVGDVTLALDGTKILANASKHSAVSHGHAVKQMVLLEEQIAELLAKADAADSAPLEDGLTVPGEIARRRERLEKLREATTVIEARAKERHREELAAFEARQRAREERQKATGKKPKGREPKRPQEGPRARDQYNFTDAESRVMKAADGFQQSYNAQAAVEIESRLVVSPTVTDAPNDRGGGGDKRGW